MSRIEHINVTVADPDATARILCQLFDWHIRWTGAAMGNGRTVHVGGDKSYVALFSFGGEQIDASESYRTRAGLNHIGIVTDDLDQAEQRVITAGYRPEKHADYEPGRRFYFTEENGVEIEVVSYD